MCEKNYLRRTRSGALTKAASRSVRKPTRRRRHHLVAVGIGLLHELHASAKQLQRPASRHLGAKTSTRRRMATRGHRLIPSVAS
jgi:hypothetical protein